MALPSRPTEHHVVRLHLAGRNVHARRARRHSRNREASSLRALAQQPLDVFDGHVPFDEVAVDFRGMQEPIPNGSPTPASRRSDCPTWFTSTWKPASTRARPRPCNTRSRILRDLNRRPGRVIRRLSATQPARRETEAESGDIAREFPRADSQNIADQSRLQSAAPVSSSIPP